MGIGVVSGMGIPAALYCVVIVGTIGAFLGGTRALMSGPSVPLAVIAGTVLSSGEVGILQIGIIVIMAGAIQVGFGLIGIGRYIAYLPHIVLTGFMSGIGCFLLWSQSWRLIGLGMADMAVAGTCLATILVWPRTWNRYVPSQLAWVAAGWSVSALWLPGSTLLGALPTDLPVVALTMPSLAFPDDRDCSRSPDRRDQLRAHPDDRPVCGLDDWRSAQCEPSTCRHRRCQHGGWCIRGGSRQRTPWHDGRAHLGQQDGHRRHCGGRRRRGIH